jgi:hypothetical protein
MTLKRLLIAVVAFFVLVVVGFPILFIGGTFYYAHAQTKMVENCRESGGVPAFHTSGDYTSCEMPNGEFK